MTALRPHVLYSATGRVPWLIAAALLAILLTSTVLLSREFRRAEEREIARYFDSIVTHIETDLIGNAQQQAAIQSRMATRLAFDGPFDRAAWRSDANRLIEDNPFYLVLALLERDYTVRWMAGDAEAAGIELQERFPLSAAGRRRLANRSPEMVAATLEPLRSASEHPAIVFMTPISTSDEIVNWLAAVMIVPDSIRAMLTGFYLRDVVLEGSFNGVRFAIPESASVSSTPQPYRRSTVFELGDGRSQLTLDVALRPQKIAEMRSALPVTILVLGSLLSVLLVVAALLAMAAARQTRVLSAANRKLKNEIRDRELAERELEFLLTHDSLTELPNRQGMLRRIERAVDGLEPGRRLALFYVDLDQFKDINETLGHHLGDELLRLIPARLAQELDDNDVIGRLGGDEFLVVVQRRSNDQITRLAGRLLKSLDQPFRIGEHELFANASIGIAFLDSGSISAAELVQNADAALFRAKQLGRNQFATFTPEMFARVEYRLNLSREIRQALDENQFRLVYQPIVDLETLELRGVEALLRWPHRDGYNVPPRDFIRVAEETGVVHRLSQYALSQAIADLARWRDRFEQAPWLAVNISGAQFRESEFVKDLSVLLHHHGVAPGEVHLEITEQVLIENMERNRAILEQFDEIGIPVVVDDFGVGYSSLAYIKNFPVSTIKIDQGFVRGLEHDPDDRAITRTICDLSRELSLATVAEGIERQGQLSLLRRYGCRLGQGFLFMHPAPAATITEILERGSPWHGLAEPAAPDHGNHEPARGGG